MIRLNGKSDNRSISADYYLTGVGPAVRRVGGLLELEVNRALSTKKRQKKAEKSKVFFLCVIVSTVLFPLSC